MLPELFANDPDESDLRWGTVLKKDSQLEACEEAAQRLNAKYGAGYIKIDRTPEQVDRTGRLLDEGKIRIRVTGSYLTSGNGDLSTFWQIVDELTKNI